MIQVINLLITNTYITTIYTTWTTGLLAPPIREACTLTCSFTITIFMIWRTGIPARLTRIIMTVSTYGPLLPTVQKRRICMYITIYLTAMRGTAALRRGCTWKGPAAPNGPMPRERPMFGTTLSWDQWIYPTPNLSL